MKKGKLKVCAGFLAATMAVTVLPLAAPIAELVGLAKANLRADEIEDPPFTDVRIDEDIFPDDTFRAYVETLDIDNYIDSDGYRHLNLNELKSVTNINIENAGISDLSGIEKFLWLGFLFASGNDLSQIDLSDNTQLSYVDLSYNNLEYFMPTGLTNLVTLDLRNNGLSYFGSADAISLQSLLLDNNGIYLVDLDTATNLEHLSISNNRLGSLTVFSSHLYVLNTANNEDLRTLQFATSSEDVHSLQVLNISNCDLSVIDFGVEFPYLTTVYAEGNNLQCIYLPGSTILQGRVESDDSYIIWSEGVDYWYYGADQMARVDEDVEFIFDATTLDEFIYLELSEENFPDETFREYLAANYPCDERPGWIRYRDVSIIGIDSSIGETYGFNTADITTVQGIDLFPNLESVSIWDTSISELTLADYSKINWINLGNNNFESLSFTSNYNLERLYIYEEDLTSLDLSGCSYKLDTLDISECANLAQVDISNCPTLVNSYLFTDPESNEYTDYTLRLVTAPDSPYYLEGIRHHNNTFFVLPTDPYLLTLDDGSIVDANFRAYVLENIDLDGNGCLSREEMLSVTYMDISNLGITTLQGIHYFENLEYLDASNNELTDVYLDSNFKLQTVEIHSNHIWRLKIGNLSELTRLDASFNELGSQDTGVFTYNLSDELVYEAVSFTKCQNLEDLLLQENPDLGYIYIYDIPNLLNLTVSGTAIDCLPFARDNQLEALIIEDCRNLTCLDVSGLTHLKTLDVCLNPTLTELYLGENPNLDVLIAFGLPRVRVIDVTGCPRLLYVYEHGAIDDDGEVVAHYFQAGTSTRDSVLTVDSGKLVLVTPADNFLANIYRSVLGREPEQGGFEYWMGRLDRGSATGADVIRNFVVSPEFLNMDVSNEDFLDVVYQTFFNRAADQGGKTYWVNRLNNGLNRMAVINNFINSQEFSDKCAAAGIQPGNGIAPNVNMRPSRGILQFTDRFYTECYGRVPDQSGSAYWAQRIANGTCTGREAARQFFFSAEFINANHSNSEFVRRLYRTLYGRTPSAADINYWVTRLENGTWTRKKMFDFFSTNEEYVNICNRYGITL